MPPLLLVAMIAARAPAPTVRGTRTERREQCEPLVTSSDDAR